MGFSGPGWAEAGAGRSGRTGSGLQARPVRNRIGFSFFSNLFLMRKQIPEKSRNCVKARKILRKSQKILGKFLEIAYDMNNPNKAFGAHEKDFRAF
jgi:hypothetical protein